MTITNCRVCLADFFEIPLLRFENAPKAAQFFPTADTLQSDEGICLEVYQCSRCGLVQLNNDPPPYYREVIRASGFSKEMTEFRTQQFDNIFKRFSIHNKKVAEIGCGKGEYLSIINQLGVQAFGIEYAEASVKTCQEKKLNVLKGYINIPDYNIENGPFHAILILSFLEHVPDPNIVLAGIHHNMTDDAIAVIEVPNFNMILERNLFAEFISDHLVYFTKETLTRTLEINGFDIVETNTVWHDYIISAIVKKRPRLNISHFSNHQKEIEQDIATYCQRFGGKKIAIWGAGHQALLLMSLLDCSPMFKYVIDSADYKQHKYTPVTHIPIVPPDVLETDPVEAVIIMAASYSFEISRILKNRYAKV